MIEVFEAKRDSKCETASERPAKETAMLGKCLALFGTESKHIFAMLTYLKVAQNCD